MNKIPVRTRNFFDSQVVRLIIDKYGLSEKDAIEQFICSETYQMLIDKELEIYKMSHLIVFDMWEAEKNQGDPRKSQYIEVQA